VDRPVWRTRFGRVYGSVVRQTTWWWTAESGCVILLASFLCQASASVCFRGLGHTSTPVYTVTTLELGWVCAVVHTRCQVIQKAWGIRKATRRDYPDISRFRASRWQIRVEAFVREYNTSLAVRSQYPWSNWSDCFKLSSQLFSINFLVVSTLGYSHPEPRKKRAATFAWETPTIVFTNQDHWPFTLGANLKTVSTLTLLWFFLTISEFDLSPFYYSQEGSTPSLRICHIREKFLSFKLDIYNQKQSSPITGLE
jgi:hypothetical protein